MSGKKCVGIEIVLLRLWCWIFFTWYDEGLNFGCNGIIDTTGTTTVLSFEVLDNQENLDGQDECAMDP